MYSVGVMLARSILAAAVSLGWVSTSSAQAVGGVTGSAVQPPPERVVASLTATLKELTSIDQGMTLGTWTQSHRGFQTEAFSAANGGMAPGAWCARATQHEDLDWGGVIDRAAVFYPPAPPSDLKLPNRASANLRKECVLGNVSVEVREKNAQHADRVAELLRQAVSAEVGTGKFDLQLHGFGAAYWFKEGLWRRGRTTLYSARTVFRAWPSGGFGDDTRVFLVVAADRSCDRVDTPPTSDEERASYVAAHNATMRRIETSMNLAQNESAAAELRSRLQVIQGANEKLRFPDVPERAEIVRMISRWVSASAKLPPRQRAAALFAADQLFSESGGAFWEKEDDPLARMLTELGAEFRPYAIGDGFAYQHTWLKQARTVDPDGPVGESAFYTLMTMGFETSGMCIDQGGEGFRAVISEGSRYLQQHPRTAIAPDIHLMMADAYADIVALADGGGYDPSESQKYAAEAPSARLKAIDEYRFALRGPGLDTSSAARAWTSAWSLLAGIARRGTRFYCVYD
jgi:hypothetical protein